MQPASTPSHSLLRRCALLFTALILIAPLLGSRHVDFSKLRAATMSIATLGYLCISLTYPKKLLTSFFKFPQLPAFAFLLWAAARYIQSTPPTGPEHAMALVELRRIVAGVLILLCAPIAFSTNQKFLNIWLAILICASLDSLAGIATIRPAQQFAASAAYFNKQLLAAFLVGLIPFSLVALLSGPTALVRRLALPTLVLLISAMLLTGNRTSWAGAIVGLFFAAIFSPRHKHRKLKTSRLIFPIVGIALIVAIICLSGATGFIRKRFDSESFITFEYRFPLWQAAVAMIHAHPVAGIGIGAYPLHASAAANHTHAIPDMQSVMKTGPTLWCIGHNEYLQTAAEIGLIGASLYIITLLSFLVLTIRSRFRLAPLSRRALIAATASAVIAQSIDALANPGWRFIDVDPILWLMLALGAAAIQYKKETASIRNTSA